MTQYTEEEITFELYAKDQYDNFIFISNEGKYYNENGNIISIEGMKINFDLEESTPNLFDDDSDSDDDSDE